MLLLRGVVPAIARRRARRDSYGSILGTVLAVGAKRRHSSAGARVAIPELPLVPANLFWRVEWGGAEKAGK